jgi:hypothetical protein
MHHAVAGVDTRLTWMGHVRGKIDIDEKRVSRTTMVPTMFVRLLRLGQDVRDRYDLSSLKEVSFRGMRDEWERDSWDRTALGVWLTTTPVAHAAESGARWVLGAYVANHAVAMGTGWLLGPAAFTSGLVFPLSKR